MHRKIPSGKFREFENFMFLSGKTQGILIRKIV
jgi:hypothetical protein